MMKLYRSTGGEGAYFNGACKSFPNEQAVVDYINGEGTGIYSPGDVVLIVSESADQITPRRIARNELTLEPTSL